MIDRNTPRVALFIGPGALLHAASQRGKWDHIITLGDDNGTALPPQLPADHALLPGLHRQTFSNACPAPQDDPRDHEATLTHGTGDPLALLRQLTANVDEFHVLADPAHNPEHNQSDWFFRQLARLATPAAMLHFNGPADMWSQINAAGFRQVSATSAQYRGGPHRRALLPASTERAAIVIGAGLAGTAAAAALAKRGWGVTLIDQHAEPAQGASGNLAGVISPVLSKDDNRTSRLSRASFYYLLRELRAFDHSPHPAQWAACGVMQLAKDEADAAVLEAIAKGRDWPREFCEFMSADEITARFKLRAAANGVWFPEAGWVSPPSVCAARIASHHLHTQYNTPVTRIEHSGSGWSIFSDDTLIAQAPVLILANSYAAASLPQAARLHFKKVRGQVTHLQDAPLPQTGAVWQRDGYLTPEVGGARVLAATYDFDNPNPELQADSHRKNLDRIPSLFPGFQLDVDAAALPGRASFRALTIDRLPLVGAIPDFAAGPAGGAQLHQIPRLPGLYGVLGLGSRGITWSALAGETLASLISAEPLPIEQDLMDSIDPARFWVRQLREA